MEPESTNPDAPDLVAEAAAVPTGDLLAELRLVSFYRTHPDQLAERHGYLSGLLHGRGIDPNTYTIGAGDSVTTDHKEPA